jgi:prolyl-tRNA synthetase
MFHILRFKFYEVMLQSELFYKTSKVAPKEAEAMSHKLLLRAGFISQLASGIYNFLPLGLRVHKKIEEIIRQEINSTGAQEVYLASLQPKELWKKTNRWDNMDPPLFKVKDRHKKEFALGSTHEEVITDLAKSCVQSYKDLPVALYQIQNKFRNEMRFTGGLLRTREFMMKDLYSFHQDKKDFENYFGKVLLAYDRIFKRCGLQVLKSEASGGVFTKEKTYEFQVLNKIGEDKIVYCQKCKWASNLDVLGPSPLVKGEGLDNKSGKCPRCSKNLVKANSIEVGHAFQLATKYSKALNFYFLNKKGEKELVIMGCYGIGIGRLMATIVEINNDKNGIIWPKSVAPFLVHLIEVKSQKSKVKSISEKIYDNLQKEGIEVLYDDRQDKSAGEKFAEADLIGIPWRLVVSERTLKKNSVEVKERGKSKAKLVKIKDVPKLF